MVLMGDTGSVVSRVTIILNGNKPGHAAERARQLLGRQGVEVSLEATRSAREGQVAAERALARGAQWIIAAGGDGTVLSVLAPVVRAGATLALLPLGTANDFASYLAVPDTERALAALERGAFATLDVGQVSYRDRDGRGASGMFCSSAGIGVMARLAQLEETELARQLKRRLGNAAWPMLVTAATLSARVASARIALDGDEMQRPIAALELLKVPRVGGFEVSPDASADSGILHAWIGEGTTRRELLHTLRCGLAGGGKLLASRHLQYVSRDPMRNRLRKSHVQRIDVHTEPALPLHLNGDHVGSTPASFRLLSAALRVRLPRHHPLVGSRAVPPAAQAQRPTIAG